MKTKVNRITCFFSMLMLSMMLAGCGDNSEKEEIASWEKEIEAEELAELEAVEHQAEEAKSYSKSNDIQTAEAVYVYVCGKVNRPGVYELPAGSRIYEAIELAGGMTEEALSESVNQALTVEDGMQITVPGEGDILRQELEAQEKGLINLNTADVNMLTTLKGIGNSRAESIVAYREENGPFKSIEDIMNVPGIKQGAFEKIKDSITVY